MTKLLLAAAVCLLAVIAFALVSSQHRADVEQHERAQRSAAYLDCKAHAKDPDLCVAP
jgi:hypothetical protein